MKTIYGVILISILFLFASCSQEIKTPGDVKALKNLDEGSVKNKRAGNAVTPDNVRKTVLADEVEFEKVDWGLTKNLVGPRTMGSKILKVNITEYLPDYRHELHCHPNQEEVIYVLSGKGISRTKENEEKIGPGSVVYIPAGVFHATINASDSESLKAVIIKAPPGDEEVKS